MMHVTDMLWAASRRPNEVQTDGDHPSTQLRSVSQSQAALSHQNWQARAITGAALWHGKPCLHNITTSLETHHFTQAFVETLCCIILEY